MKIVTFCGHSDVIEPDAVWVWLTRIVERLIISGAQSFYLGGYGAFARMAAAVVWELKQSYPHIESVLVLPYLDWGVDTEHYDCTTYPPLENVPKRYAILRRNQWMVERADVIVSYVTHAWGGAAKTLEHAKRKKKKIINYTEAAMYLDELFLTEEEIQRKEESLYLLRQLTALTEKGKMRWRCTKYFPWELIPDGADEPWQEILTHAFGAEASYGMRTYRAEVSEGIGLDNGSSKVIIDVKTEAFDQTFYPTDLPLHTALAFSDAVLEQIHDSEIIKDAFRKVRDKRLCAPDDRYTKHPLTQLGEKLRSAGEIMAFHRLVKNA